MRHQITPIRPPEARARRYPLTRCWCSATASERRVLVALTSFQGAGAEAVGTLHQTPIEVQSGWVNRSRRPAPATLEGHACPHAVRFKRSTGWKAEAMASYLRARVRGRASISEDPSVYVDRSERRCPIKQSGYQENIGYPARVRRRAHRLPSGRISS